MAEIRGLFAYVGVVLSALWLLLVGLLIGSRTAPESLSDAFMNALRGIAYLGVWALLIQIVPVIMFFILRRRLPASPRIRVATAAGVWGGWTAFLCLIVFVSSGGNITIDLPGGPIAVVVIGGTAGAILEVLVPQSEIATRVQTQLSTLGLVVLCGVLASIVILGIR